MNEKPLVEELGDDSISPYKKYLDLFVGEKKLSALIRYELIAGLIGSIPGALGYYLRKKTFPIILGSTGRGCIFGKGVTLRNPRSISIGEQVMVDDHVVIDAKGGNSAITAGDQILIGRHSILSCNDSIISIGSFVSIGPFCFLVSRSALNIGSNVAIGAGTYLLGGGHEYDDPEIAVIHQKRISKGIVIEDNAWIGIGVKILDGVTIGKNSIVGAGAVVSKDVPPYTVALGNPARIVEKRKR